MLRAYKKGERKSKEMAVMSEGLDDALIDGLAAHYSRQKARGWCCIAIAIELAQ